MRSSTIIFDRVSAVLGQPFVLGRLAEMVKLDLDSTRRLVAQAVAVIIAGFADRAGGLGTPSLAATEFDSQQTVTYLLGKSKAERIEELSEGSGVTAEVVEALLARIVPIVAEAVAGLKSDLGLSDTAFNAQLGTERRALHALGLIDVRDQPAADALAATDSNETGLPDTNLLMSATETRNVAKVRVPAPHKPTPSSWPREFQSIAFRPWIWWSVAVVASIVLVAILLDPPPTRSDEPSEAAIAAGTISTGATDPGSLPADVLGDAEFDPGFDPELGLLDVVGQGRVAFEPRSAVLTDEGAGTVDRVAEFLLAHRQLRVEVGGHTGRDGPSADNLRLSQARAQAVVDRLVSAGVDGNRLVAVGYGEADPLPSNDPARNEAGDGRIEFLIR